MNDNKLKQAADFLDGARRTLAAASAAFAAEHERLANSGKLFPSTTIQHGREVTRFSGDIAATFGPWMAPPRLGRVTRGGR